MYLERNQCSMSPQGDEYFNVDLKAAVECYTRAIECDASNALFPLNRAEALLKQERLVIMKCCGTQLFLLLFIKTTVTNTSSSCSFYSVIAVL